MLEDQIFVKKAVFFFRNDKKYHFFKNKKILPKRGVFFVGYPGA